MDCIELKQPNILAHLLRKEDESILAGLSRCFFELYLEYCKKYAQKYVFINYSFNPEKKEELVLDSFVDTLAAFFKYIKKNDYEDRGYKFDTFFIQFFKGMIRSRIKKEFNFNSRLLDRDPGKVIDFATETAQENPWNLKENLFDEETKYALYQKGLLLLSENCRNLIKWRKLDRLSNEEIAEKSNLMPGSVNNEVHKCLLRLKKILDEFFKQAPNTYGNKY